MPTTTLIRTASLAALIFAAGLTPQAPAVAADAHAHAHASVPVIQVAARHLIRPLSQARPFGRKYCWKIARKSNQTCLSTSPIRSRESHVQWELTPAA